MKKKSKTARTIQFDSSPFYYDNLRSKYLSAADIHFYESLIFTAKTIPTQFTEKSEAFRMLTNTCDGFDSENYRDYLIQTGRAGILFYDSLRYGEMVELLRPATLDALIDLTAAFFAKGTGIHDMMTLIRDRQAGQAIAPFTRDGLFFALAEGKMPGSMAYRIANEIAGGSGLCDWMRDEMWMAFTPEWLESYCSTIQYLPNWRDMADLTRTALILGWFKLNETKTFYNCYTEAYEIREPAEFGTLLIGQMMERLVDHTLKRHEELVNITF